MAIHPVEIGELVAGKYIVEAIIGEGGMGVVVAARHVELDQRVAIKFLLTQIANHGTAAERFRREARSAARIRGEHVCRVLDVGTLTNGVPYLVMEHLEGCDLALELERRGRLPLSEAVEYILQACEGLAEAHAANIVHRDLKPANLFLAARADGSRRVKVLDFGVSKSLSDSGEGNHALTQTSSLVGSPLYMSPEQLSSSKSVDARSDIWALGAVLYELVAGRPPFNGENIPQLVHAVMNSKPLSLEALDTSLPRGIDAVVMRALQKQRDDRFANVAELANELAPYAPRHALLSVSRVSRLLASSERRASAAQGLAATESADETPQRASNEHGTPMAWSAQKRQARTRIGVGVVIALLGAVAALVYVLSTRKPEVASPARDARPAHVARPAAQPAKSTTSEAHAPSPQTPPAEPEELAPNEDPVPELLPNDGATPAVAAPAPIELTPGASHERRATRRERPEPSEAEPAGATPAPTTSPAPAPSAPREPPDKPGLSDFGGRR